jgi:hypothetical protein
LELSETSTLTLKTLQNHPFSSTQEPHYAHPLHEPRQESASEKPTLENWQSLENFGEPLPSDFPEFNEHTMPTEDFFASTSFISTENLTHDIDSRIDEALQIAEKLKHIGLKDDHLDIPTFLRESGKEISLS